MKGQFKLLVLLVVGAMLMTACVPGVESELMGYCEADGLVYVAFTNTNDEAVDLGGFMGVGEIGPGETVYGFIEGEPDDLEPWCPPSPPSKDEKEPLIYMTVFYSESGFYEHNGGVVNTCSVFFDPEVGNQPSTERVAFWCTQVPEDIDDACTQPIYDDGAGGIYACDSFLKSVGERRAALRNDIQGPDFDLLPKIMRYKNQLEQLDLIQ